MNKAVTLGRWRVRLAWVTLNRPDALNAINNEVRDSLPQCIRGADADEAVRVIVVRGAGQRAFCAWRRY